MSLMRSKVPQVPRVMGGIPRRPCLLDQPLWARAPGYPDPTTSRNQQSSRDWPRCPAPGHSSALGTPAPLTAANGHRAERFVLKKLWRFHILLHNTYLTGFKIRIRLNLFPSHLQATRRPWEGLPGAPRLHSRHPPPILGAAHTSRVYGSKPFGCKKLLQGGKVRPLKSASSLPSAAPSLLRT